MKPNFCLTASFLTSILLALPGASPAKAGQQQNQSQAQQSQQSQPSQQPQQPKPGSAATASTIPQGASSEGGRPELHQRYPRYKIGANDVLDLTFRYTPEFNQEV